VIDRIVSPEDGVVHHTHVARTSRKHIVLIREDEFSSSFCKGQILAFFVAKTGVGINERGVSAHGFL
jgi:hypothetical protein